MNEQGSEASRPSETGEDLELAEERSFFAYQGSRIPLFVVVIWATFLIWGIVYLVRWVPESWREWFAR